MEQIPEPPEVAWGKAGTTDPDPKAKVRMPGFTFLAWLTAIASAAVLQGLRATAGRARAVGLPGTGTTLDTLAVLAAIALACAALAYVVRRWFPA